MLDLNITLFFQLANFFIAILMLNILLIRPIRTIIKKRKDLMDGMSDEASSFEDNAAQSLDSYEAALTRARQDAGLNREQGRAQGATEQQSIVSTAQKDAHEILTEAGRSLLAEVDQALDRLRAQVGGLSSQLAKRVLRG